MGRAYSIDLRERVVAAVERDGLPRHQAAAQFGVGISTVTLWVQRFRRTGSVAPDKIGGYKAKKIDRGCPSRLAGVTTQGAGLHLARSGD